MNFRNTILTVAAMLLVSLAAFGQTLEVGDRVWAQWEPNDWYPGVLTEQTVLGFMVAFDNTTGADYVDPDLPAVADIPAALIVSIRTVEAEHVTIGTRVLAEWAGDEWFYPATVVSQAQDGSYGVVFDDRDTGTADLTQLLLRGASVLSNDSLNVGDAVWAQWEPNDWYPADILEASDIGFRLVFRDADGKPFGDPEEASWADRPRSLIVPDRVPSVDEVAFGTRVLAYWADDDWLYPATVVNVTEDGMYEVLFDDREVSTVELAGLRLLAE